MYHDQSDTALTASRVAEGSALQSQIWAEAMRALHRPETPAQAEVLLLAALNDMFDMATTRAGATMNHPPVVIYYLLAGLSLVSALLVGYVMCGTQVRSWFYMLLLTVTLSITFYVILDLEYPRSGAIRVDSADQMLRDLGRSLR